MAAVSSLYSQLQLKQKDDIRLIKILPVIDGKVSCKLITANLDKRPQYVAISYTWGPSTNAEAARGIGSTPTRCILCNDYEMLVTENLYGFLVRAAENIGLSSAFMWIDSLCIDQSALLERTSQVRLMERIYRSASSVVVWLGEEDEHTKRAFELMQSLGRHSDDDLRRITPRNLNSKRTLRMVAPCSDLSFWLSLVQLFRRRYFTRVWIIQEITLASDRLAVCGSHTINWDHVVKVSKFLTVTSWTRWICAGGIDGVANPLQSHHAIPNLLEATKRSKAGAERDIFLYSLIRARRFEASDPRDKIYGLLGISDVSVTGKARYNPVYGLRSTTETYILAAIQMLLDSDDLLLLACAEGEVFQTLPDLPSWVPDWSSTSVTGLGITGYKRFSAAGNLDRFLQIDEKNHTVVLSGKRVDTIISTSETKREILQGKSFPRLLQIFCAIPQPYHTNQSPSEVLWRSLLTDTAGLPPVHPAPEDFAVGFSSWFSSRLKHTAEDVNSELLSEVLELLAKDGLDLRTPRTSASNEEAHQDDHSSLDAGEYEATISHSQHLRAFSTTNNYFGLGSESLQENDEIWIVAGSRVPLILRQTGQSAFRLVGGAYVHGIMHGETLDKDEPFKEIMLH